MQINAPRQSPLAFNCDYRTERLNLQLFPTIFFNCRFHLNLTDCLRFPVDRVCLHLQDSALVMLISSRLSLFEILNAILRNVRNWIYVREYSAPTLIFHILFC